MGRNKKPEIRSLLIERAAQMLHSREPVTLRSLVAGMPVSTMAVYTYFDGMDGLWKALRQEGFTRLSAKLDTVTTTDDPVHDQIALGAAYMSNALENPDLYRVMFDASVDLEDAAAADRSLHFLVEGVERCSAAERFRSDVDPLELATQQWMIGHGLASLVATGPLPEAALAHAVPMLTALFVAAGDDPDRCRRSVAAGWALPGEGGLSPRPTMRQAQGVFRLLFHEPRIPPNTGNAIRLAANTGCELHLVEPLGFDLSEPKVKRAGLDYHDMASVTVHADLFEAWKALAPQRVYAFTAHADTFYTDIEYQPDDVLLFGPEPTGLSEEVLADPHVTERVRIPMLAGRRSLNLANAASIVMYEAWRQHGFPGAV